MVVGNGEMENFNAWLILHVYICIYTYIVIYAQGTTPIADADLEELDDVAGAEDAVGGGELVGLGGREVGGEDAAVDAAAAEDLARRAGAQHHRRLRRRGRRRRRSPSVRQRGAGRVAR